MQKGEFGKQFISAFFALIGYPYVLSREIAKKAKKGRKQGQKRLEIRAKDLCFENVTELTMPLLGRMKKDLQTGGK